MIKNMGDVISVQSRRYYEKNGDLYLNHSAGSQEILIDSESDLNVLRRNRRVEPGAKARIVGTLHYFEMDADRVWHRMRSDGEGEPVLATMFDGTNTTEIFTQWIAAQYEAAESGTPDRYAILDKWFAMLQDSWAGVKYTLKYENVFIPNATGDSTMIPMDDLSGKTPAPCCTSADEDTDHWMDEDPMYWYIRFNAKSKEDGTMDVLAIEGIDDAFDITGELAPVYTASVAWWVKNWIDGDCEYKSIATTNDGTMRPLACDVAPDGMPRHMTWHATFSGVMTSDGKLTSGIDPDMSRSWLSDAWMDEYGMSHIDQMLQVARSQSEYDGLYSITEMDYLIWLWQFRHFTLTNSGVLADYSRNYSAGIPLKDWIAIAETVDSNYIILAPDWGRNFYVGSSIRYTTSDTSTMYYGIVTAREDIEVDGSPAVKVYVRTTVKSHFPLPYEAVDDGENFTFSVAAGSRVGMGVYRIPIGETEALPYHKDGSIYSCTSGERLIRIGGIESMASSGLTPVLDPVICFTPLSINSETDQVLSLRYEVYGCRNAADQNFDKDNQDEGYLDGYTLIDSFDRDLDESGMQAVLRSSKHVQIRNDGYVNFDVLGNGTEVLEPPLYGVDLKTGGLRAHEGNTYLYGVGKKVYSPYILCQSYGTAEGISRSELFSRAMLPQGTNNYGVEMVRLGGCGKTRGVWNGFKKQNRLVAES